MHKLPKLGFSYDSLEPYIDAQTMEIHYTKHHQTYLDKLNASLEKHPELENVPTIILIKDLNKIPEDIRTSVRNNGGGHVNHSFFWTLLKKGTSITGKIKESIEKDFGSFENFKMKFSESAANLFGSGWTWLVLNQGKLEIVNTSGHDNPISQGKTPLLVIDVWEHAYYLKYKNKRADYIEAFFKIINWDEVNKNYIENKS